MLNKKRPASAMNSSKQVVNKRTRKSIKVTNNKSQITSYSKCDETISFKGDLKKRDEKLISKQKQ